MLLSAEAFIDAKIPSESEGLRSTSLSNCHPQASNNEEDILHGTQILILTFKFLDM
jgi:hypothetical protein